MILQLMNSRKTLYLFEKKKIIKKSFCWFRYRKWLQNERTIIRTKNNGKKIKLFMRARSIASNVSYKFIWWNSLSSFFALFLFLEFLLSITVSLTLTLHFTLLKTETKKKKFFFLQLLIINSANIIRREDKKKKFFSLMNFLKRSRWLVDERMNEIWNFLFFSYFENVTSRLQEHILLSDVVPKLNRRPAFLNAWTTRFTFNTFHAYNLSILCRRCWLCMCALHSSVYGSNERRNSSLFVILCVVSVFSFYAFVTFVKRLNSCLKTTDTQSKDPSHGIHFKQTRVLSFFSLLFVHIFSHVLSIHCPFFLRS